MRVFLLAILICAAFAPAVLLAQTDGGLVPCGNSGQEACDTKKVLDFANGMVEFLLQSLGIIAVIVLVVVGFRMVLSQGNESEWGKAKDMFANVVIGIILILAAWLIVDTVLAILTGTGLDGWSQELYR